MMLGRVVLDGLKSQSKNTKARWLHGRPSMLILVLAVKSWRPFMDRMGKYVGLLVKLPVRRTEGLKFVYATLRLIQREEGVVKWLNNNLKLNITPFFNFILLHIKGYNDFWAVV